MNLILCTKDIFVYDLDIHNYIEYLIEFDNKLVCRGN